MSVFTKLIQSVHYILFGLFSLFYENSYLSKQVCQSAKDISMLFKWCCLVHVSCKVKYAVLTNRCFKWGLLTSFFQNLFCRLGILCSQGNMHNIMTVVFFFCITEATLKMFPLVLTDHIAMAT